MKEKEETMKLQLKHLATYLPYDVRIKDYNREGVLFGITGSHGGQVQVLNTSTMKICDFKGTLQFVRPVLHPLSDLDKNIDCVNELYENCSEIDSELDYLPEFKGNLSNSGISYEAMDILISWHFDVFGLIDNGLAIDINTLKE